MHLILKDTLGTIVNLEGIVEAYIEDGKMKIIYECGRDRVENYNDRETMEQDMRRIQKALTQNKILNKVYGFCYAHRNLIIFVLVLILLDYYIKKRKEKNVSTVK